MTVTDPSIQDTASTAPTRFVEASGIRFAYRRFGGGDRPPLVMINHFRGNLDTHDPAFLDAMARDREVIVFNNAGVASSTGTAKETVKEMGRDAASFIDSLGLDRIDVYGISMGGFVAQQLAVDRPELVRRIILVGTGPRAGAGQERLSDYVIGLFTRQWEPADLMWEPVFFTDSAPSRAAARAYLDRIRARADQDVQVSAETAAAHSAAAGEWGRPGGDQSYLRTITAPVLVVNGSNDVIVPTYNSFVLQQELPNAQLVIYPDSNHGSVFQYPREFIVQARSFLDG